jgi:hypothetical protein
MFDPPVSRGAVMNVPIRRRRILRGIERDLSGSDPGLAGLFSIFTLLTQGEEMPDAEKARAGSVRVLARLRRAARRDRPGARSYTRLWLSLSLAAALVPFYTVVTGGNWTLRRASLPAADPAAPA